VFFFFLKKVDLFNFWPLVFGQKSGELARRRL